jgi:hypothetical protein
MNNNNNIITREDNENQNNGSFLKDFEPIFDAFDRNLFFIIYLIIS